MSELLSAFSDAFGWCLAGLWYLLIQATLLWTLGDADERAPRWGCLVTVLVALTWPLGLVLYLVLRQRLVLPAGLPRE